MKREISIKRIEELLSRFEVQVSYEASLSRTDLNKSAETILIPLLNEIHGWNLENINYAEDDNNYPGIDLADKAARICVQVTATNNAEKVKHTLRQFIKYEQYRNYDRLIVFFLKQKRRSYRVETIQPIVEDKFDFDIEKDVWDFRNLLKEIDNSQNEQVTRVREILEANFGDDSPTVSKPGINWQETCQTLLEQWKGLTTNALTKPDGVRFQLNEVFVPLGVVERQNKPRHAHSDGSPERGSELYKEKVTPISQDDFFEQVLRQGQSQYSQGKRIAIIGEPGAGKTTQLQRIGDWILRETDGIPIWIPLSAVGEKDLRHYLTQDWLQTAISELEATEHHRDELAQLLKTGKVWLLLDGVDEMAVSDTLHHIAAQMREGWLRDIRVVLTCRLNVWEVSKNALDNFDVYRNLDFDYPTEIHQFLEKWFWQEPDLQEKLKEALEQPGKERIQDLVKNPLRLTLLCYSWQIRQGELPETKAGLYEWFVDAFYEWNKGKVPCKLNSAKRNELNQALGKLAREAIDQNSSRFRLSEKFVTHFLGDADDEGFLCQIALQLGWLNRIGVAEENASENVYAFLHPTFQEYFAALAIDDWDLLPREHVDKPIRGKEYRVFEPLWQEIISLWIGCQGVSKLDKQKLIDRLVTFKDGCNSFFGYKAFFFASLLSQEFRNCEFQKELIEQLVLWALGDFNKDLGQWETFLSPIAQSSFEVLSKLDLNKDKLLEYIQGHKNFTSLSKDEKHSLIRYAYGVENEIKEFSTSMDLLGDYYLNSSVISEEEIITLTKELVASIEGSENLEIIHGKLRVLKNRKIWNSEIVGRLSQVLHIVCDQKQRKDFWFIKGVLDYFHDIASKEPILITQDDFAVSGLIKLHQVLKNGTLQDSTLRIFEIALAGNEKVKDYLTHYLDHLRNQIRNPIDELGISSSRSKGHRDYCEELLMGLNVSKQLSKYDRTVECLAKIDFGNQFVFEELLKKLCRDHSAPDQSSTVEALKKTITRPQMSLAVESLRKYITSQSHRSNSFEHFSTCYEIIWYCAQNMSYSEFYESWHNSSSTDTELPINSGEVK